MIQHIETIEGGHIAFLAERAYIEYGARVGFRNYRGEPMPQWMHLPQGIRDAWMAAVTYVKNRVTWEITAGEDDAPPMHASWPNELEVGDPSLVDTQKLPRMGRTNEHVPPADHSARDVCGEGEGGEPNRELRDDGQQRGHAILSAEERAKGFVRPVRASYVHKKCGVLTSMPNTIAETYARSPSFYSSTFCCGCKDYFRVGAEGEFVWDGTDELVGT